MDQGQRKHERLASTGSVEERAAHLAGEVRAGRLSRTNLALAAALGHTAAQIAHPLAAPPPMSFLLRHKAHFKQVSEQLLQQDQTEVWESGAAVIAAALSNLNGHTDLARQILDLVQPQDCPACRDGFLPIEARDC